MVITIESIKYKIKDLLIKVRHKIIEALGGYIYRPVPPLVVKRDLVKTVPISASIMVNKGRYDSDIGYRAYVRQELSRILAGHILEMNVMSSGSIVELNDNECAVKVTARFLQRKEDGSEKD